MIYIYIYRCCLYENQWFKYLDLVGLWVGAESTFFLLLYLVLVKAGLLLCFFSLFSTVLGSGFGGQEKQILRLTCAYAVLGTGSLLGNQQFVPLGDQWHQCPACTSWDLRADKHNSGLDEWHWFPNYHNERLEGNTMEMHTRHNRDTNIVKMQWNTWKVSVTRYVSRDCHVIIRILVRYR